jgi:uroporphyrinogen decarboxylase
LPPTAPVRPILQALRGETLARPPLWLMRQAGRYLPEYRRVRAEAGSFMDLCLTPELAVEVTLQPLRRFPLDAAILFSDILIVPHGLGQSVSFAEGHGPVLEPLGGPQGLARLALDGMVGRLAPVYETVRRLRAALPAEVALIGFAGAPWTVASYMVEGGSSRDYIAAKGWAYRDPAGFDRLIALLVEATVAHLSAQIEAGADLVQLFDSWIGALPAAGLERWGVAPCRAIIAALRARHPGVPVILFPRGAGAAYSAYSGCGAAALGLDTGVPLDWAARTLQPEFVLQGNIDPVALLVGGPALEQAARAVLQRLGPARLIVNLGHGVLPETPPEHVAALAALVRGGA